MIRADRPERFRMQRAPLAQAIAQVQFPLIANLETLAGVAALQGALLDDLPYMEQAPSQELTFVMGLGFAPQGSQRVITTFKNDAGWTLQVQAGSATLTAPGQTYEGSEMFAAVLRRVLDAMHRSIAGLRRCDRIGVRYVSFAPADEQAWSAWFRPEIVGWSSPALLAEHTEMRATISETRTVSRLGGVFEDALAEGIVRHGLLPPGTVLLGAPPRPVDSLSFVLDIDLFVANAQLWNPSALVEEYEVLHGEIERFFFWSLTDEGQRQFELEWVTE